MGPDKIYLKAWVFGLMLCLTGCGSANAPDLNTLFVNLSQSFTGIWYLVTAVAYVLGFLFVAKGVYALKVYGEMRTMTSNAGSFKTPATFMIVGAALIYLPNTVHTFMQSTFGYASPLDLTGAGGGVNQIATQAIFGFIQLVGVIAFIRGWIHIARAGDQHSQPGSFGRGLTHIIGGLLAINIVGARNVLFSTLGFS